LIISDKHALIWMDSSNIALKIRQNTFVQNCIL